MAAWSEKTSINGGELSKSSNSRGQGASKGWDPSRQDSGEGGSGRAGPKTSSDSAKKGTRTSSESSSTAARAAERNSAGLAVDQKSITSRVDGAFSSFAPAPSNGLMAAARSVDRYSVPGYSTRPVDRPALEGRERDAMIRTVYGEAGNQGNIGRAAVASTILNRVDSDRFPGSVERVVKQPSQFEPWGTDAGRQRMQNIPQAEYERIGRLVDEVTSGVLPDMTGGATHFANEDVVRDRRGGGLTSWMNAMADTRVDIGDHTFYGGNPQASPFADRYLGGSTAVAATTGPRSVRTDSIAVPVEEVRQPAPAFEAPPAQVASFRVAEAQAPTPRTRPADAAAPAAADAEEEPAAFNWNRAMIGANLGGAVAGPIGMIGGGLLGGYSERLLQAAKSGGTSGTGGTFATKYLGESDSSTSSGTKPKPKPKPPEKPTAPATSPPEKPFDDGVKRMKPGERWTKGIYGSA